MLVRHFSLDGAKARGGQGMPGLNSRLELVLCADEIHRHFRGNRPTGS